MFSFHLQGRVFESSHAVRAMCNWHICSLCEYGQVLSLRRGSLPATSRPVVVHNVPSWELCKRRCIDMHRLSIGKVLYDSWCFDVQRLHCRQVLHY